MSCASHHTPSFPEVALLHLEHNEHPISHLSFPTPLWCGVLCTWAREDQKLVGDFCVYVWVCSSLRRVSPSIVPPKRRPRQAAPIIRAGVSQFQHAPRLAASSWPRGVITRLPHWHAPYPGPSGPGLINRWLLALRIVVVAWVRIRVGPHIIEPSLSHATHPSIYSAVFSPPPESAGYKRGGMRHEGP